MDEKEFVTKTVCLPYLKQLQYVDMQLTLHHSLLDERERAREEKQQHGDRKRPRTGEKGTGKEEGEDGAEDGLTEEERLRRSFAVPSEKEGETKREGGDGEERRTTRGGGSARPTVTSAAAAAAAAAHSSAMSSPAASPMSGGTPFSSPSAMPSSLATGRSHGSVGSSRSRRKGGKRSGPSLSEKATLMSKYPALLSLVEEPHGFSYAGATGGGGGDYLGVVPQVWHPPRLFQFIEEVYDARFKFEYSEWREGPPKKKKKTRRKKAGGTEEEEGEGGGDGSGGGGGGVFEKVDLHRTPGDFAPFVHSHCATAFGLRALVRQTCWDLVYTLETYGEENNKMRGEPLQPAGGADGADAAAGSVAVAPPPPYLEEARLFGLFLRGVYGWKDLLFFLYARDAVQASFRVQLSARRDKLLDQKHVMRAAAQLGQRQQQQPSPSYGAPFAGAAAGGRDGAAASSRSAVGAYVSRDSSQQTAQSLRDDDWLRVPAATPNPLVVGGGDDGGGRLASVEHCAVVVTEDHGVLGGAWRVCRLSKWACLHVCQKLFHNDKPVAKFLFGKMLMEHNPDDPHADNSIRHGVPTYALLFALLDEFRAIPDEFAASQAEDDTAETVAMLQGLKAASGSDEQLSAIRVEIEEQLRVVASQSIVVSGLERDNDNGKNRTSLFLARNELWRQETVLAAHRRSLRNILEHEDQAWRSVIEQSDEAIRALKAAREKRRPPTVPAALFNLGAVVELMHAWQRRRKAEEERKARTLRMMAPLSVEKELERLRLKAVIQLQREWRRRLAARKAEAEANAFLDIKRAQRDAKIAERKRKDAEIEARRAARAKQAALERQQRSEAEKAEREAEKRRRARMKARQQRDEAERRFQKRLSFLRLTCFQRWRRYTGTNKLRRKVYGGDMRRRLRRWQGYARARKNMRAHKDLCAECIQRFARACIAKNVLRHARAERDRQEAVVRGFLKRILNAHAHRAFVTWHWRAHSQRRGRNLLRNVLMGAIRECWTGWREFVALELAEKGGAATLLQAQMRAKKARRAYARKVKRHRAACTIQRCARARSARKILHRAKARQRRDERRVKKSLMRIKMHLESRVLLGWHRYAYKMRRARRFVQKHMRSGMQKTFEAWHAWAGAQAGERLAAALVVQRRYRSFTAIRATRKLLRFHRAAVVIQREVRMYLEADTIEWLRLYRDAATEIQRGARAFLSRAEYVRRRIANYFKCAEQGDYWHCQKAFERGEGFSVDESGDNLLMCAARGGSKRVAKLCLRRGIDPNAYNKIGLTAIHHLCRASYLGQEILLEYLLSKGCSAKTVDFSGATPLVDAARLGHMDCVKKLVECHADIDHRDNDGCSVLQIAASRNQIEVVNFLAKECDADVENVDNSGCNVLHDVATRGMYAMLAGVIPHCYNLDLQDSAGHTPLHLAVFGGHAECVRLLILAECDSNIIDSSNRTALHHAVFKGQQQITHLICEGDTDLAVRDEDGDTALHAAAVSGENEICEMLLAFGADHSIRNDHGDQPAHLAARKGHVRCLEPLMEYECNVNMKNFDGRTPLGEARINGNMECVALFERLYTDEAKAAARVKRAKARLAALAGKEVVDYHKDRTQAEKDKAAREDKNAARQETDWLIRVPTTLPGWTRLKRESRLNNRVHKWEEWIYEDTEVLGAANDKKAAEYKRLGRPPPEFTIDRCFFWYNTETRIYQANPPDDLIFGVWRSAVDPDTGETVWTNEFTDERHVGDLPPQHVHTRAPKKMRVLKHVEEADVSSTEYQLYWQAEMAEGQEKRARLKAAQMIQRQYRAYRGRVYYTRLKKHSVAAIQMQRVARGFLGRVKARDQKIRIKAVTAIQKNWRAKASRAQLEEMRGFLERRRAILRAAKKINRVWRGYLCRRRKRRLIWRRDGPQFHDQWMELVSFSTVRRVVGVWDEMVVADSYDVLFYHNHINRGTQWAKPETVEAQDVATWEDDRMLRIKGFTRAEDKASRWLQGIWRGRMIRATFRMMVRGAKIMRSCEDEYLSAPNDPVNLCNYMLFLHVEKRNYNKARPLYARALEMMSSRGPDNAFILFAYAMFVTATREEDFDEVMNYVRRARAVNKTGTNRFNLAEKGFFRQVAVLNPRSGQALANYAICLQFLRQDYDQAEEFYIKACEADPYDQGIVENFNNMLKRLKGAPYDGFDAFRRYQAKKARDAAEALQKRLRKDQEDKEHEEEVAAATKIQRLFLSRHKKQAPFWKFTKPPSALEKKRLADEAAGLDDGDPNLHDHSEWEECSDGLGGTYYYNTRTGESKWERPKFRLQDAPVKKGAGYEGVRGGALEDVEDWEECLDHEGKPYYFCKRNGKSQWVRPRFRDPNAHPKRGEGFGDAVKSHDEKIAEGRKAARMPGEVIKKEYPSEWAHHASEDGKTFWWNSVTGESRWVKPTMMTVHEEATQRREAAEAEAAKLADDVARLAAAGAPWEKCNAEEGEGSGHFYWYNTQTGESRWELDVDREVQFAEAAGAMRAMAAAEQENAVDESVVHGHGQHQQAAASGDDPGDWEEAYTDTGDRYFYNTRTGESRWG